MAQRPNRRSHSAGVTARLVALVMIPLTVMCGLAGHQVSILSTTASQALRIDSGAARLNALVGLHAAVAAQQALASFDVRFDELGVTIETASTFMGIDLVHQISLARTSAASAIDALGPSSPVRAAAIDALYADADSGQGALTSGDVVAELQSMNDSVKAAISGSVHELEALGRSTNASALMDSLESLQLTDELVDSAAPQGIDLSALWFPASSTTPQSALLVELDLSANGTTYDATTTRIRELGVDPVVAGIDGIEADPRVRAFDRAVTEALHDELPSTPEIALLAAPQVYGGYLARSSLLGSVVIAATAAVRREALALAGSERRAFLLWAGLTGLFAVVALAITLGLAHSIAKPLRRLAGYAHAVNEGDFDRPVPHESAHVPREITVALAVVSQLVANLRLLDAKANALATCTFDDPVLALPLPGRLGQSLESSVAVLSGSIVERDRLQTHLAHQATHDSLTGLANRPAAIIGIQDASRRAARNSEAVAVLFLDLNYFKSVNDSRGHETGDHVLRTIADRLTGCVRDGDLVSRFGGDEFVIIAERLGGPDDAMDLARRVVDAVSQPIGDDGPLLEVGVAIGIAMNLDWPEEPLRFLARADAAMYRAKKHHGSAIEMFDSALELRVVEG